MTDELNTDLDRFRPDHHKRAMRFLHEVKSLEENYPDLEIHSSDYLKMTIDLNSGFENILNEEVRKAAQKLTDFADQQSAAKSVVLVEAEGSHSSSIMAFLNQVEQLAVKHEGHPGGRQFREPTTLGAILTNPEDDVDLDEPVMGFGKIFVDFFDAPADDN